MDENAVGPAEKDPARDEALRLDGQMCFPLYAAARKIVNLYTPYFRPMGLTYTRYIVLLSLWQYGSMTVGELCRRLYLDSGTMTPLLKKMAAEGLVLRTRSGEDERVVRVDLTEKGLSLRESVRGVPSCVGKCVGLSDEERNTLYRLLCRILDTEGEDEG